MFLTFLNTELKEKFLRLCVHAAVSNDEFAEAQLKTLEAYCKELNVPTHIPEIKETDEQIFKEISDSCTNVEKNVILIEIISFINCDGVIDEKEQVFLKKLVSNLNISDEKYNNCVKLIQDYSNITKGLLNQIVK